jgi:hypothetical protein
VDRKEERKTFPVLHAGNGSKDSSFKIILMDFNILSSSAYIKNFDHVHPITLTFHHHLFTATQQVPILHNLSPLGLVSSYKKEHVIFVFLRLYCTKRWRFLDIDIFLIMKT